MEQRWMVDSNDMPSGDIEFWALRRGKETTRANPGGCDAASRRRKTIVRAGLSVLTAVAIAVAI